MEIDWGGSAASVAASATQAGGASSWGGLYGEPKSVYDPCPAGWRVPSGYRNSTTFVLPWSVWSGGSGNTTFYYSYLGAIVYPWMGYRNLYYTSMTAESYHWTASNNGANASFGYCNNSALFNTTNCARYYACAVRCVKEW